MFTACQTWMLIAALYVPGKTWKQPSHSLVDEWINLGTSKQ